VIPADRRPHVSFYDIVAEAAAHAARGCGGTVAATADQLVSTSDIVVLAVRPPEVRAVLGSIGEELRRRPLVSLAAGVGLAELQELLPAGSRVGRVMPNVAAAVGAGVFLLVGGSLGPSLSRLHSLFSVIGAVVEIAESSFDAATAISGCGPGYVALFMEALENAGVAAGLEPPAARALSTGAFVGTAELVRSGRAPAAVRAAICSPGGMTAAGIDSLENSGVRAAITAAVDAAVLRAQELK
jgi:pyrroline-5-carboxylate reductase